MLQETNIKQITDSLFDDIQKSLIEKVIKNYAKMKCQELLMLVAEKAKIKTVTIPNGLNIKTCVVDEESILNAVDLETFIK